MSQRFSSRLRIKELQGQCDLWQHRIEITLASIANDKLRLDTETLSEELREILIVSMMRKLRIKNALEYWFIRNQEEIEYLEKNL
jgi:hypothetical protein